MCDKYFNTDDDKKFEAFMLRIESMKNSFVKLDIIQDEIIEVEKVQVIKNPYRYIKSDDPSKPHVRMVSKFYYFNFATDDEYDTEDQDQKDLK